MVALGKWHPLRLILGICSMGILVNIIFFISGQENPDSYPLTHQFRVNKRNISQKEDSNPFEEIEVDADILQPGSKVKQNFGDYMENAVEEDMPVEVNLGEKMFKLHIWSMNLKSGIVDDLKHLLQPMGVQFIESDLLTTCHVDTGCLDEEGHQLPLNMDELLPRFQQEFKTAVENHQVDALLCVSPPSICEWYMTLGKRIIVVTGSHRYEMGIESVDRWRQWNVNLQKLSMDHGNTIAATNRYDVEYMYFYTHLRPILLPSYCAYVNITYDPIEDDVLLLPAAYEPLERKFVQEFNSYSGGKRNSLYVVKAKGLYPDLHFAELSKHPAVVVIPHQVSFLLLTELYRANVPLFVPSLELLIKWDSAYNIMAQRTFKRSSVMAKLLSTKHEGGHVDIPDPNFKTDDWSKAFWLQLTDFYTWPHVNYFNTIHGLVDTVKKMKIAGQLRKTSKLMRKHNANVKLEIYNDWVLILDNMQRQNT